MPIVNFEVPRALETRVKKAIRERGFSSKAEFFRMAAFNYLNETSDTTDLERLNALTKAIKEEAERKFHGKRLPSAKEHLANL